ncbi:hypothetical protein KFE26_23335 [Shewanella sp. M16]|uniref:hypothetical protein n=1 Tax=Shewanella sp. M16 TaxID=2830837 RepID=UPI001BAFB07F|nr:hypothetical protein [Shewanella sp. M16]MBS0045181.1 hypothetical protein [Shewanella sp. M16]
MIKVYEWSVDSEEKSGLEKGVLNKKVGSNYKKDKSSWGPMICYSIALKFGVLDKTIKKETRDTINNMLKRGEQSKIFRLNGSEYVNNKEIF